MVLLLLGCVRAWHADHPGRFDLDPPSGWSVTRNTRFFGNDFFTLRAPTAPVTVSIECIRLDARSRRLPPDLLAETRALHMGRALGVDNVGWRMDRIDVDGHEAWAMTGRRTWHAAEADFTLLAVRLRDHVAFVTLQTPVGGLGAATPAWAGLLESLRFPRDPVAPDAPLFPLD